MKKINVKKNPDSQPAKREMTPQEREVSAQVDKHLGGLDEGQKHAVAMYSSTAQHAASHLARKKLGPTAPAQAGFALVDQLSLDVSEVVVQAYGGEVTLPSLLSILATAAGYQVGVAMAKTKTALTAEMIDEMVAIFKGGLLITSEAAKDSYGQRIQTVRS